MKTNEAAIDTIHNILNEFKDDVFGFHEMYDGVGICMSCAFMQDGVEPDAEGYTCDSCGKDTVTGIENAILCNY